MSTISVVIPVYNAGRYVRRAAQSVLMQPQVAEVLLIEDGSSDNSLHTCEALAAADTRVQLVRHPSMVNVGAAAARNLGIAAARAPLIAFLDADDFYLPERFAIAMERLEDPAVDGVYEAIGVEYESDAERMRYQAARGTQFASLTTIRSGIAAEELCARLIARTAGFCHLSGLTVRRELLERSGGFAPALRLHQDTHLLIRLAYHGRLMAGVIDRPVAMRYVHANNRITLATPEVSLPYRRLLNRSLIDWALRESLPRELLRLMFLRVYRETFGGTFPWGRPRSHWRMMRVLAREFVASPLRVIRALLRLWHTRRRSGVAA